MKSLILIACAFTLGYTTDVYAGQFYTGNEMATDCHIAIRIMNGEHGISESEATEGLTCLTYVQGFLDAAVVFHAAKGQYLVCKPDTATYGQAVKILTKWLDNNPAHLNAPASVLAEVALHKAWPCKGKK